MRSYFLKKIIQVDTTRRNYLLRKLTFLRKRPHYDAKQGELIRLIRKKLKGMNGKIYYYRVNKGCEIFMGDETSPKRSFLLFKDNRIVSQDIRKFRSDNRAPIRWETKQKHVSDINSIISFRTVGGVSQTANYFHLKAKDNNRKRVVLAKLPKDNDPYIGIELEYASSLDISQVVDKIVEHKLQNKVRVVRDSSIRCNSVYENQIEFCILTKWSELNDTLLNLKSLIFDKPQYFSPNSSCGLHVHLDMRHDDPRRVFRNLACMQGLLFSLAAEHRRENTYCLPVHTTDFDAMDEEDPDAHYSAISKHSFIKHKTIEVRIHESTLDLNVIQKWITLLKRIADYRGSSLSTGSYETELKNLIEKIAVEPEIITYIQGRKGL
jgi:hypothetical protein